MNTSANEPNNDQTSSRFHCCSQCMAGAASVRHVHGMQFQKFVSPLLFWYYFSGESRTITWWPQKLFFDASGKLSQILFCKPKDTHNCPSFCLAIWNTVMSLCWTCLHSFLLTSNLFLVKKNKDSNLRWLYSRNSVFQDHWSYRWWFFLTLNENHSLRVRRNLKRDEIKRGRTIYSMWPNPL